eukprot:TRINITY_DN6111_c0_g1_i4.p2 TRINITY_DN6111_c0_g1~~TRINITY_DN6111_c0_g1_i4.p2  ORF type:complete len:134 (-),score=34.76 TRINITY_DN6111_c0_g1_i4:218-568(-)
MVVGEEATSQVAQLVAESVGPCVVLLPMLRVCAAWHRAVRDSLAFAQFRVLQAEKEVARASAGLLLACGAQDALIAACGEVEDTANGGAAAGALEFRGYALAWADHPFGPSRARHS